MAFSIGISSLAASTKAACRRNGQTQAVPRRCCVVVQAQKAEQAIQEPTRRELLGAAALSAVSLLAASPAQAFLGIGEGGDLQDAYATRTTAILTQVQQTLDTPKDDPTKEDKVKELRKDINSWVATYRREPKVSGRPSYGQTYSVLNALAGHYNSFGATAPIPKKRLDRITKEIGDANTFLSRGR